MTISNIKINSGELMEPVSVRYWLRSPSCTDIYHLPPLPLILRLPHLQSPLFWFLLLASIFEEHQTPIFEVTEPSPENQVFQSSGSSNREPCWSFELPGVTVNTELLKNLDIPFLSLSVIVVNGHKSFCGSSKGVTNVCTCCSILGSFLRGLNMTSLSIDGL